LFSTFHSTDRDPDRPARRIYDIFSLRIADLHLLRDGEIGLAMLNLVLSNTLGVFMVWLGYVLGRVF
jgi:hypothetical protein